MAQAADSIPGRAAMAARMAAYVAGVRGRPIPAAACPAAVLVPVLLDGGRTAILLTRRAANLSAHAGQISFPGGRIEPGDASPEAAALREAQEEVGLDPQATELIGRLDTYGTGTGFSVVPVVGLVSGQPRLRPDPVEVAEVIALPLEFVLDRRNHGRRRWREGAVERSAPELRCGPHVVWGATAGILVNFCEALGA